MALPILTAEQRQAALEKAAAARQVRAEIKDKLKHSRASLTEVLQESKANQFVAKLKVIDLLQSMPGVGKVKAAGNHGTGRHRRQPSPSRSWRQPDQQADRRVHRSIRPFWPCLTAHPNGHGWSCSLVRPPSARAPSQPAYAHSIPRSGSRSPSRPARPAPGEVDGVHYHFIGDAEFDEMVADDGLLEWAVVHGAARYGTPRAPVEERLAAGKPALLEIDLQGARQVRARMPDALMVFLAPRAGTSSCAVWSVAAPKVPRSASGAWRRRGSSSRPRTSSM